MHSAPVLSYSAFASSRSSSISSPRHLKPFSLINSRPLFPKRLSLWASAFAGAPLPAVHKSTRQQSFRCFSSAATSYAAGTASQPLTSSPGEGFATESSHHQPAAVGGGLPTMVARTIDGTSIAKNIRNRLKDKIEIMQLEDPTFRPSLTIVQVGTREDSSSYVRMKLKAAKEAGIVCNHLRLEDTVNEEELLQHVHQLNNDPSVHGILVQLPLPESVSERAVTSAVAAEKDVDGFGPVNVGELTKRRGRPSFLPCTPLGVMVLLKECGVDLVGKHAVVLGRSDIVGTPVSQLLKNADATVTICHSKTQGLKEILKLADVIVAAIGKPEYIKGDWIKPGAVVIDVGINYLPDNSKKSGYKLVGDVEFSSASETASQITPVPGGVGPMTVAMLLQNVVDAAAAFMERRKREVFSLDAN